MSKSKLHVFFLVFLIIANISPKSLLSQDIGSDSKNTQLIVIGTVHENTPNFSVTDLVEILNKIHPDIILCEYDSSFFDKDFNFRKVFKGLEQTAVVQYLKQNQAILRPYDIEGRNDHYRKNKTLERENEFFDRLNRFCQNSKYDAYTRSILKEINVSGIKRDLFQKMTPREINSFKCDKIVAEKTFCFNFGYSEVIERNPELQEFFEFWNNEAGFEDLRNQEMVRNIVNFASKYQGKTIVILCGYEHRYQLRYDLRIPIQGKYELKEFWEYK